MKLNINYVDLESDARLSEFIQKKVDKLETFYDRIVSGDVYLKKTNTADETCVVELKLYVPGSSLFANKDAKTFEEGIDSCVEAMKRQISKLKEKQAAHPQQP